MTKDAFLKDVRGCDNYRHLLWPALETTKGDVIELGMSHESTPYLHYYCEDANRRLFSFDNNLKCLTDFSVYKSKDHAISWTCHWDGIVANHRGCDVLLVANSQNCRQINVQEYKHSAKIIVLHDNGSDARDYFSNRIWPSFKYCTVLKTEDSWDTIVSNFIPVSTLINTRAVTPDEMEIQIAKKKLSTMRNRPVAAPVPVLSRSTY